MKTFTTPEFEIIMVATERIANETEDLSFDFED